MLLLNSVLKKIIFQRLQNAIMVSASSEQIGTGVVCCVQVDLCKFVVCFLFCVASFVLCVVCCVLCVVCCVLCVVCCVLCVVLLCMLCM